MDHNYGVKINYDPGLCNIRGAGWFSGSKYVASAPTITATANALGSTPSRLAVSNATGVMITATAAPCRDCVRSRAINVIPIMVIRGAKCTQRICYQAGESMIFQKPEKNNYILACFSLIQIISCAPRHNRQGRSRQTEHIHTWSTRVDHKLFLKGTPS